MPSPTFDHCAVAKSDTEIIVFGGNEYGNEYLDKVSILDTVKGNWTELDEGLPTGRASVGCLATTYNGKVGAMVTGGCLDECLVIKIAFPVKILCHLEVTNLGPSG